MYILHRNWFELMVRSRAIFSLVLFDYKIYRLFFIHDKLNDYLLLENLLQYEGEYIRRYSFSEFSKENQ